MSLDPKSLDRLKQLGRKLPKEIPVTPPKSYKNHRINQKNKNLHPIETEENPEKLFYELMNASQDGIVPDHLVTRLKNIEGNNEQINNIIEENSTDDLDQTNSTKSNISKGKGIKNNSNNLYVKFSQLLLEEDS